MTDSDGNKRAPMSIRQQAEFLDYLVGRCTTSPGTVGVETWLRLEPADIEDLRAIAQRLHRMAPHEAAIRRMVTGR